MNQTPYPNCPTHNVPLELRQGRYGEFLGCGYFASTGCKYVVKLPVANVGKSTVTLPATMPTQGSTSPVVTRNLGKRTERSPEIIIEEINKLLRELIY